MSRRQKIVVLKIEVPKLQRDLERAQSNLDWALEHELEVSHALTLLENVLEVERANNDRVEIEPKEELRLRRRRERALTN